MGALIWPLSNDFVFYPFKLNPGKIIELTIPILFVNFNDFWQESDVTSKFHN